MEESQPSHYSLIPRSTPLHDELVPSSEEEHSLAIPVPSIHQLSLSFHGPYNRVYIADFTSDILCGSPHLSPGSTLSFFAEVIYDRIDFVTMPPPLSHSFSKFCQHVNNLGELKGEDNVVFVLFSHGFPLKPPRARRDSNTSNIEDEDEDEGEDGFGFNREGNTPPNGRTDEDVAFMDWAFYASKESLLRSKQQGSSSSLSPSSLFTKNALIDEITERIRPDPHFYTTSNAVKIVHFVIEGESESEERHQQHQRQEQKEQQEQEESNSSTASEDGSYQEGDNSNDDNGDNPTDNGGVMNFIVDPRPGIEYIQIPFNPDNMKNVILFCKDLGLFNHPI